MLHRVQPATQTAFAPNARLSITPEYLAALVESLSRLGIDIVSLDEALCRVAAPRRERRFVSFTFDDGYRDNLMHALPIFQRAAAPFTVYATSGFVARTAAPWWSVIERVITRAQRVCWRGAGPAGADTWLDCADLAAKQRSYAALARACLELRADALQTQLAGFAADHDLSLPDFMAQELCSAAELRALRAGGATIGCHTHSHARLSLEPADSLWRELDISRRWLEGQLGCTVDHLAFPYGRREHVGPRELAIARELRFRTATTTRQGALFAAHAQHPHAWPRIEVTPSFAASPRYLHTILTGAPLWLRNRGRLAITD